tara:strand:+ start:110 stop:316 length:207 start_codon:yes stop_codon:yes gene_type:complete
MLSSVVVEAVDALVVEEVLEPSFMAHHLILDLGTTLFKLVKVAWVEVIPHNLNLEQMGRIQSLVFLLP